MIECACMGYDATLEDDNLQDVTNMRIDNRYKSLCYAALIQSYRVLLRRVMSKGKNQWKRT